MMKKITPWLIALSLSVIQLQAQSYVWDNVAIGGGGYVAGLVIHPTEAGLMYMRTDIGGVFKWDNTDKRWRNLSGWIAPDEDNLFGTDGIALDKNNPDMIYALFGKYNLISPSGIYKSEDRGANWEKLYDTPCGGNQKYREVGEPIQVDPNNSEIIYCGTRTEGLLKSTNSGESWSPVTNVPWGYLGDASNYWEYDKGPIGIRSVAIDGSSTTGGKSKNIYIGVNGSGIYRSADGGNNFSYMSGSPADVMRISIAPGNILYVSTESGVKKYDGSWYSLPVPTDAYSTFNGISVDPHDPERLYVTTGAQLWWQRLYRSYDAGASWQVVYPFDGNVTVHDNTWHSGNLGYHQAGTAAVILDPHQEGRLYTTDWYQVWRSPDAWNTNINVYNDVQGHEEVVPLAICTPHEGVQLFSGHGDVVGFKHYDQATLPIKQLADKGECTGIDYCESNPAHMAIVTASDWYGKNTEIYTSSDYGDNFSPVNLPSGGLNGKIAIAANDPQKMVYVFGGSVPYYTNNGGTSWNVSSGAPSNALSTTYMYQYDDPLISDRTAANTFFLLDRQGGNLYKSTSGGASWYVQSSDLPASSNYANLAAAWGSNNNLMAVSMGTDGLWLSNNGGSNFSKNGYFSNARMVAIGLEKPGISTQTLYVFGVASGQWGVYRSNDFGLNWVRINDNNNYVGNSPTYMGADRQEYGRVYVGNNGSGLFYGAISGGTIPDPDPNPIPGENVVLVRAKMVSGSGGNIELQIDDTSVVTWTLTSNYVDYTYSTNASSGNVKVYFQDNVGDAQIDYITSNGATLEAEDQVVNTGVWQGSCGGTLNEKIHCPGYIDFGTVTFGSGGTPSPVGSSLVTNHEFDNGTTGWSTWGSGASLAAVSNAAMSGANAGKVTITSNPTNSWDIGLFTGGISLVNGTTYTISFAAKAVSNKSITLDIEDNGTWKTGFYPTITTTTANYSFDYTASSTSGSYGLKFLIGANNADFWIDNVKVAAKSGSRDISQSDVEKNDQIFDIYPNPSNGKISIDFHGDRIDHADIYDTAGKIVYTVDNITAGSEIDLSHLKSHIYFIKTSVRGEQIFKKIILIKE